MTFPEEDASDSGRGLRMQQVKEAVPRKEGESRKDWKGRVFAHKRKEEERLYGKKPPLPPKKK